MSVKLYTMTCGWLGMSLGAMLEGETGRIQIPVPVYLIDHPKGRVLFDSGLHIQAQTDPAARLGWLMKAFTVEYKQNEDVAARLRLMDIDAGGKGIRYLVNSHLHFDHAGGNEAIPNAQWVLQKREWEAANDPDLSRIHGLHEKDYDHGHDRLTVDGEHDLFGDGRVVCIPTFGHTPGHQSLLVRTDDGEVLLTGDACYLRRSLENMQLPKHRHSAEEMLDSLRAIRAFQNRGARIIFGHDPDQWRNHPGTPSILI